MSGTAGVCFEMLFHRQTISKQTPAGPLIYSSKTHILQCLVSSVTQTYWVLSCFAYPSDTTRARLRQEGEYISTWRDWVSNRSTSAKSPICWERRDRSVCWINQVLGFAFPNMRTVGPALLKGSAAQIKPIALLFQIFAPFYQEIRRLHVPAAKKKKEIWNLSDSKENR